MMDVNPFFANVRRHNPLVLWQTLRKPLQLAEGMGISAVRFGTTPSVAFHRIV
jgi:hypothetical protein